MKLLFLEGRPGIGKTTMLLECSKVSGKKGNGYITQRIWDREQRTLGFQLKDYNQVTNSIIEVENINELEDSDIFIKNIGDIRTSNLEVFSELDRIVGDYSQAEFILLDEVGGVQFSIVKYVDYMYRLLESGIPCIGVLKSRGNYNKLGKYFDQSQQMLKVYEEMRRKIEVEYEGKILELSHLNQNEVKSEVMHFFQSL